MALIPEKYLDLLGNKKAFANLATTMADGSPQVTPVWFDYTGNRIRVNTARGRVKARNMKEGSKVALAIMASDSSSLCSGWSPSCTAMMPAWLRFARIIASFSKR